MNSVKLSGAQTFDWMYFNDGHKVCLFYHRFHLYSKYYTTFSVTFFSSNAKSALFTFKKKVLILMCVCDINGHERFYTDKISFDTEKASFVETIA